jgi:hypothetical protein
MFEVLMVRVRRVLYDATKLAKKPPKCSEGGTRCTGKGQIVKFFFQDVFRSLSAVLRYHNHHTERDVAGKDSGRRTGEGTSARNRMVLTSARELSSLKRSSAIWTMESQVQLTSPGGEAVVERPL